jgi:hypothetical protein
MSEREPVQQGEQQDHEKAPHRANMSLQRKNESPNHFARSTAARTLGQVMVGLASLNLIKTWQMPIYFASNAGSVTT